MLIEEAVYSLFSADTAIKEIVSDNIYPVTMPQLEKGKTFYPALVVTLESRDREQTHQGPTGNVRSHFVMSCLGTKYFEVKQLADKVRLALNGKSAAMSALYDLKVKGIFFDGETDDYVFDQVEELALYHIPQSFTIQHWEPLS
jgi:hypothetical protein